MLPWQAQWQAQMVNAKPERVWKELALIPPEAAEALGVPAEAPVLISPAVRSRQHCWQCDIDYGPLVYPIGPRTSVTTMHTHTECLGIFHHHSRDIASTLGTNGTSWFFGISKTLCLSGLSATCSALRTIEFKSLTVRCANCRLFIKPPRELPLLSDASPIFGSYRHDAPPSATDLFPVCCGVEREADWTLVLREDGVPTYHNKRQPTTPVRSKEQAHEADSAGSSSARSEFQPASAVPAGGLIRSRRR